VFPVTLLDQQELQRGLGRLSHPHRLAIQQKARNQAESMTASFPRLAGSRYLDDWTDQEIDRAVEQFSDLSCPALQADGSCGVYQSRPLTCRSMGIPVEVAGLVQGACSVQTSVPLIRLSPALRLEEDRLARVEAMALEDRRKKINALGEEILLPFAFLPETFEVKQTT
jgi:Fe-S-cluster containining protein